MRREKTEKQLENEANMRDAKRFLNKIIVIIFFLCRFSEEKEYIENLKIETNKQQEEDLKDQVCYTE